MTMVVTSRLEAEPRVLVITIDRPPVNALNMTVVEDLINAFATVGDDVHAVILTGAGERAFCAGADTREIGERTPQLSLSRSARWRAMFEAIRSCPVPVIAAVNGHAVGAGSVIAACSDILIAADEASFSLPEILVGVMGGTRHVSRLAPAMVVRRLALTGERISAAEFARWGGIRTVLPRAGVFAASAELACEIASRSPSAVRLMKESMNVTEAMPISEGYRIEQLFTTVAAALPKA